MRDPGRNTWTFGAGADPAADLVPPAPFDALSDPSVEDLLPAGLALWPRGAAWGTPDGQSASTESGIANLTRALLAPFTDLYRRADGLTKESRAQTLVDSLPDWEADFGLPDECAAPGAGEAARRRALISRVRSLATITPADFVALARQEGFEIAIEEPSTFECGFSECGGAHTTGGVLQQVYWIVHVYSLAVDYFTCGESECGADPLFEVEGAERLACLFRRLYPGWTQPIYEFHDVRGADDLIDQVGPGIALDFLDGSFAVRVADEPDLSLSGDLEAAPGFTFTRASTAMRTNAAGVYESVAPGVLRIDYEPITLAPRGALFEGAATNLLTQSETLSSWYKPSVVATPAYAVAPNNLVAATLLVQSATTGNHFAALNLSLAADTTYTFSVFVKAAGCSRVQLGFDGINGSAIWGNCNLDTGEIDGWASSGTSPPPSMAVARWPNGWCRVALSGLPGVTLYGARCLIHPHNTPNAGWAPPEAGDGTSGILVWGAQLETGKFASSYIPTTTGTATRAADALTFPTSAFPYNSSEGTLFLQARRENDGTDRGHTAVALITNASNRIQMGTLTILNVYAAKDGVQQANTTNGFPPVNQTFRFAAAWKANDFAALRTGGALYTRNAFDVPTATTLAVGNVLGSSWDGYIEKVAAGPRRPSNAELQAITP